MTISLQPDECLDAIFGDAAEKIRSRREEIFQESENVDSMIRESTVLARQSFSTITAIHELAGSKSPLSGPEIQDFKRRFPDYEVPAVSRYLQIGSHELKSNIYKHNHRILMMIKNICHSTKLDLQVITDFHLVNNEDFMFVFNSVKRWPLFISRAMSGLPLDWCSVKDVHPEQFKELNARAKVDVSLRYSRSGDEYKLDPEVKFTPRLIPATRYFLLQDDYQMDGKSAVVPVCNDPDCLAWFDPSTGISENEAMAFQTILS